MTDGRSLYLRNNMAIIVDKIQKRKDIAMSCKEIFFQNGIKDLTVSQIAKAAGVGKGTLYDYFKNKEDIVFEIVTIMVEERNIILQKRLSVVKGTKEKIKLFSEFFYNEEDRELRQLYKEFISIALSSPDKKMIEFQTQCSDEYYSWYKDIMQSGIDNNEIIQESIALTRGMFITLEGMFITSEATNSITSLKEEINNYTDAVFYLIEVKK